MILMILDGGWGWHYWRGGVLGLISEFIGCVLKECVNKDECVENFGWSS